MSYGAFKVLRKKGLVKKMLVVAPLKPCWLVWPAEAEKWSDFQYKVVVLHGPDKEKKLEEDADVYVVNFDGLAWLLGVTTTKTPTGKRRVATNPARLKKLGVDLLVVDELSKVKHQGSNRHKALKQCLHLFPRRWGLTGSPAANGLMGLFGQCYVLDMGKALGQFVTHYRAKYFEQDPKEPLVWRLKAGGADQIYERLKPLVLRLAAKDVPGVKDNVLKVELPPDVRELYDTLEEDLIAVMDDKKFTAATAAVASMKCRQIAAGGLYLQDDLLQLLTKTQLQRKKRDWVLLHDEKTDVLEDLVDELQGQPLLVAYDFHHDLARIRARLGDVPNIGSGTSGKELKAIEDKWNRGELPVLLGHPMSMGHGLNLQGSGCKHVCFYSVPWDFELYDQFIRRVRRRGATVDSVTAHHIVAKDTVDQNIMWALRRKDRTQQALFDALQNMRLQRRQK